MSARRAAIRRERKEREKIDKMKSPQGEMLRAAEQGKLDGRAISFCVTANLLYDLYGFRKKKIENFLYKCNKEATRFDDIGVNFVIHHYADLLLERINKADVAQKPKSIIDHVYLTQRDEFFVVASSIMLSVLNDEYNMGSNSKNTGRLDVLMEYITNEYIKIQLDPNNHSVEFYGKKIAEKTGFEIIKY